MFLILTTSGGQPMDVQKALPSMPAAMLNNTSAHNPVIQQHYTSNTAPFMGGSIT